MMRRPVTVVRLLGVVAALQVAIVLLLLAGLVFPREVRASNVHADAGAAAEDAASAAKEGREVLRKVEIFGVRCTR